MTVTWTSGYGIEDAQAVVEWGSAEGNESWVAPAATLTFTQQDMCGKSTSPIDAILTVPNSWMPILIHRCRGLGRRVCRVRLRACLYYYSNNLYYI